MKKLFKLSLSTFLASFITLSCSSIEEMPFNLPEEQMNANAVTKNSAIASKWQNQIIYFIFTDRFYNGDRQNDFKVKANDPWAYHGGDLQGIIDKLDYIKDLGATSIWITPPMDNRDDAFKADFGGGKFQDIWGYHGYWTKDFYAVDEHLGSMKKMQELIQKAHAKGIKVLIDIVVNHLDYDHEFAREKNNPGSKYYNWFHRHGKIQDNEWDNQWKVENGELAELPDLAQENDEVYKYLLDASKWWIKQTGADGFRLDTVKHVSHDFWKKFSRDIHSFAGNDFLLLGEVYAPSTEVMASYIRDGLDSTFDFPFYYAIKETFAKGGSMRNLGNLFAKDHLYPNPNMISPFIDNHDIPRFVHEAGNNQVEKLKLAMAFIMTMRGIPTVYYGTEIALPGGADPDNRRDMQWGNKNASVTAYLKKLTSIRKTFPALYQGKQLEMWQDEQVYAYLRTMGSPDGEVITVLNNSDSRETRTMQIRAESQMANGTVLKNLLGNDSVTVENRKITINLAPKEAKIFSISASVNKNKIKK